MRATLILETPRIFSMSMPGVQDLFFFLLVLLCLPKTFLHLLQNKFKFLKKENMGTAQTSVKHYTTHPQSAKVVSEANV